MANRILLDENGLTVSYPGHNVLTAAPARLMFRSDATHLPRFDTYSLQGRNGRTERRDFGRTFSSPPLVTWYLTSVEFGGTGPYSFYEDNMGWMILRRQILIYRDHLTLTDNLAGTLHFKVWDYEA